MARDATKKTIRTFAWASFFNDMGSDMIYPVWPMFVTVFLGANMAALGLIDGLGEAFVSIAKAVSGYVSDRIGRRKPFIWTGYLFGAVSRLGYAFAPTWQALIPFKVLDRVGKMRGAPRDAMVADISSDHNRGEHFGLMKAMDNLGAVCGIVVCALLFGRLGYHHLFLLAAIPSVLSTYLILRHIRETAPPSKRIFHGLSLKELDSPFRLFLVLNAIFALGTFSYSFLLIYAKDYGFKATTIPLLYLVFTASAAVVSLPIGRISDRIGRKAVMYFSFLVWGLVCMIFLLTRSPALIALNFLLYGIHKGALDTVQSTFVSELSPAAFRATGLGVFQMAIGICALPASLIAGLLWEEIDPSIPLFFSLGLTVLATVMLLFVREKPS
jgi:MFS family permease